MKSKVLSLVLLMVALAAPMFAQTDTARLAGTVTDSTGAFISGATVTVTKFPELERPQA
jgi:hypothetical protein